jgi:hypothetical protein
VLVGWGEMTSFEDYSVLFIRKVKPADPWREGSAKVRVLVGCGEMTSLEDYSVLFIRKVKPNDPWWAQMH